MVCITETESNKQYFNKPVGHEMTNKIIRLEALNCHFLIDYLTHEAISTIKNVESLICSSKRERERKKKKLFSKLINKLFLSLKDTFLLGIGQHVN